MSRVKKVNINYAVHQWDWKEQPNWEEITGIMQDIGFPLYFNEISTGSDSYAVLISNQVLTKEQAKKLFVEYNEED